MPIYWSYKSLPELSALPAAEHKEVWKKAVWHVYGYWQTWLVLPLALVPIMLIGSWLGSMVGHDVIGTVIGAAIGGAIYERIVLEMARSYLKKTVARADKG